MIICAEYPDRESLQYDHVITDPPYGARTHGAAATMRGGKAGKREFGFAALTPELQGAIADAIASASSWSVVFCDDRGISGWIAACESRGARFVRSIPWVRWSMPQLSGDRPPQGWEPVLLFRGRADGKLTWNGPGNLTHFANKCMRGRNKHPTQKPLALMLSIVEYFTQPGSLILDPCAGRGTTAVAARLLGRHCDAYERDATEAGLANARLQACSGQDASDYQAWAHARSLELEDIDRMRSHTANVRQKIMVRE